MNGVMSLKEGIFVAVAERELEGDTKSFALPAITLDPIDLFEVEVSCFLAMKGKEYPCFLSRLAAKFIQGGKKVIIFSVTLNEETFGSIVSFGQ